MTEIKADETLDAKGLACPMPIVRTKKKMETLENGQVLEVLATDPGSGADIKAWSESVNHQFLGTIQNGELFKHYIRKITESDTSEQTYQHVVDNEVLAEKMQKNDQLTVIDVREEAEYKFNHIPNTINIPLGELELRIKQFNKGEPIYLICRTGNRSDLAAQKLVKLGFTEVYNVIPGMSGWTGKTKGIK